MPADKQDAAVDVVTGGVARSAALFVTFYVSRERASSLHKQLQSLIQASDLMPNRGQDPANRPLMGKVEPPAAHDATAIRLIFNAGGDAATAWENMQQQLGAVLKALDPPDGWWGYTAIYQAVLNGDRNADSTFSELLPVVRRVDSSESLQPLATADLSGGRVWLVDIPQQGNGMAAATICVALSPSNKEEALKRVLLGPRLLMVDLIAHKGYYLRRQYRGKLQQEYGEQLGAFWETIDELLGYLSLQVRAPDKLNSVARTYRVLVSVVSKLNRISVSMAQQLHNYDLWRSQMAGNRIVEFRYGYLEMAARELELMVAEGKDALEMANTAMSMTRIELDQHLERGQNLIGYLLAVVGAVLAVPELVDHDAAKALLNVPSGDEFSSPAFLMQIAAIVVAAVLIISLTRLVGWWSKR